MPPASRVPCGCVGVALGICRLRSDLCIRVGRTPGAEAGMGALYWAPPKKISFLGKDRIIGGKITKVLFNLIFQLL